MTREILCDGCAAGVRAMLDLPEVECVHGAPKGLASHERVRMVHGQLRLRARCDRCGERILPPAPAWACSLWSTRYGIPWREWEPEYLAPLAAAAEAE